jgi:hypothetical protein
VEQWWCQSAGAQMSGFFRELMSSIVVDCNTNNVTIRALALHRFEIVTQFSDVAKRCTLWQFAMAPGRLPPPGISTITLFIV